MIVEYNLKKGYEVKFRNVWGNKVILSCDKNRNIAIKKALTRRFLAK